MGKCKGLSSVTKKLIMAITGGCLVFFLLFHGTMNLVAIFSPEGYQAICEFLGANWYAIVGTIGIAALMIFHLIYAFVLSLQNYRARGKQRYAVTDKQEGVSWAAKNMLVIGGIVLLALCLLLVGFWAEMQLVEIQGNKPADGMELIRNTFGQWYYSVIYLVWLAFLWFHLAHGVASVMQSIGWNNNVWRHRIEFLGKFFAALIVIMFAAVVLYYWLIA